MRVRLLGDFLVSVGSRVIDEGEWRLKKAASLIKLLALAPDHRLHRERAMDLLWPDLDPRAAANNLHHALHVARRTLEPNSPAASHYLRLRGERISLCPERELRVDVEAFEDAASAARRANDPAAYRAALDLYAGDLLPEDLYEDWTEIRRVELRRLYLALLMEVAVLHKERAETGPAIEALGRVVAEEPTHEGARVRLMHLYAGSGNRGEALKQYEQLRQILGRELGTEPGAEIRRLREEIAAGTFPSGRQPARPRASTGESDRQVARHNLPIARTSFVGRERELVEIKRALAMTRLLTLTGTGGSGKTRLALEVARDLAGAYPDGAWLVELAPLSDPDLVPQAVAGVLEVREQPGRSLADTLADALRGRKILLILDNCEHLVDAVARLVDTLLASCPGLRVLATSREALGVAGEVNRVVPSLSLPDLRRPLTVEELEGYESARLFVERALYRPSAFVLTPQNAKAVAEICSRLDGIPLAIELAAARVGALAVEQIFERLKDALKLLTGGGRTAVPRQQTLRGSLDWSYELLAEPQRLLFRRVSVFAGGWTLEAAEEVGGGYGVEEDDILDLLSQLVDKSLVTVEGSQGGTLRYRMLEPVRQYASEKLEESGEAEEVRSRHAAFFLALAEEAEPELKSGRQDEWLGRLDLESDNLRAALRWCAGAGDAETGTRLAGALWLYWFMRGRFHEGRDLAEAMLARSAEASMFARARAVAAAAAQTWVLGDYERFGRLSEESLQMSDQLGDVWGRALALHHLSIHARSRGDHSLAATLAEEGLSNARRSGDTWLTSVVLMTLGMIRLESNEYEAATRLFDEANGLARDRGDAWTLAYGLLNLAGVARGRGDHRLAETTARESLEVAQRFGERRIIAGALEILAEALWLEDDSVRAARLLGASAALFEAMGEQRPEMEHTIMGSLVVNLRATLGDAAFNTAWEAGRAMLLEQAIEYVLRAEDPASAPQPEQVVFQKEPENLTRREREIADLVARGLTNRQISIGLTISERTVDNHVANILRKLGLRSRAQVTAWKNTDGPT